MMFSLDDRVGWIYSNQLQISNSVVVNEKEDDGFAEITVSSENRLYCISTSRKNSVSYLKHQQIADYTVIEKGDEKVVIHLIECKKTISSSRWEKVKAQLKGALQNSYSLLGVLGIVDENLEFRVYTAFREEKFNNLGMTDPILLKSQLGKSDLSSVSDWEDDEVKILGNLFPHKKVKLDGGGYGILCL